MQALIVVDVQNEFSPEGVRPVPNHAAALQRIHEHIAHARREGRPIAFAQHYNKPHESRAFVPGSWGAALSPGIGPRPGFGPERLFEKDVFGAFSTTDLENWLRSHGVGEVLIVGFYAHMCLSTTAREALVRGFDVAVDPEATGARALDDPLLGRQSADEVRRTAILHLVNMGVTRVPAAPVSNGRWLGAWFASARAASLQFLRANRTRL
ncbi:MAG: cysteine hydrolase family protein [Gemmatimonadota bacterium]